MPARFGIGDQVCIQGEVRLINAGGEGTVTIELRGTGQRVTITANSSYVDLVEKAKGGKGFTKVVKALK